MNDFDYTPKNQSTDFESAFSATLPTNEKSSNGFAIAALVLSVLALLFACACCTYFATAVLAVLSIVFVVVSKKKRQGVTSAMAVTALVLSILALLIFFFILCIDLYISSLSNAELDALIRDLTGKGIEDFFAEFEATAAHPLARLR